jgi:hypothetical protein
MLREIVALKGAGPMKYCMDCRFFRGNLTAEDHEFLVKLLRSYRAEVMLKSWVKLGQTKMPAGKSQDSNKAKAVQILRRTKGLCRKEHVDVYAVEQGCVFWQPKKM